MSRFKGAGAILYSPLVYQGWRFPYVQLTENDDPYLFEVEVANILLHIYMILY